MGPIRGGRERPRGPHPCVVPPGLGPHSVEKRYQRGCAGRGGGNANLQSGGAAIGLRCGGWGGIGPELHLTLLHAVDFVKPPPGGLCRLERCGTSPRRSWVLAVGREFVQWHWWSP